MSRSFEVILFDVGGVLCELGSDPVPVEWIPGDRRFTLSDWFHSEMALAFEKGEISARALASEFRSDLRIEQGVDEILSHFDDWLIGPFPGMLELLDSIPQRFRRAILSNTNALHWPRISGQFGFESRFERIFSSHLLGLAKPDPAIYLKVLDELQVSPDAVLFLDDNEQNIRSAASVGMEGVRVEGPGQVSQALSDRGIIDG